MPKTYLRYEGLYCFGVISTTTPAVDASGDRIITGSLEYVSVWHARRGTLVMFDHSFRFFFIISHWLILFSDVSIER